MEITQSVEEIVEKNVSKLTSNWLKKKMIEFKSSPLYTKEKGILFYQELIVPEFDDGSYGEENYESIEMNFVEFCRSSNYYLDGGEYRSTYLADIESKVGLKRVNKYVYGIEEVADELVSDLAFIASSVNTKDIWNFVNSICQLIHQEIGRLEAYQNEDYTSIIDHFTKLCFEKLQHAYYPKIEASKFSGSKNDRLTLKLNIEDFSALLIVLDKAGIIDSSPDTYRFTENYFVLKPNKEAVYLNARNLGKRISDLKSTSYSGKGLEQIKEKLDIGIERAFN
jgi:hypothetical protein